MSDTRALKTGGSALVKVLRPSVAQESPAPVWGNLEAGIVLYALEGFPAFSQGTRQTQGKLLLICSEQKGS